MALVNRARRLAGRVIPSLSSERRDPIGDFIRLGLFDLDYYRAQLPPGERPEGLAEARRHYVATGRAAGLALHPLIEPEWWDPNSATDDEDPIGRERWLIHGGQRESSTSVLIADPVDGIGVTRDYLRDLTAGLPRAHVPGGLTAVEAARRLTEAVDAQISSAPNNGRWSAVDWAEVRVRAAERVAGRVSVLVPTYEDWRMTVESVRSALDGAGDADVEVVVVDNGSRLAVLRSLLAVFLAEPRVRIVRCSVNTNFAGGMNRAIAASTGEFVVFLNNDAVLAGGWPAALISPLGDESVLGTQPLLLYPGTNRIQAAGTMFLGEGVLPWHFLAGHPRADADRMTDMSFRAVTAAVMAMRAADLIAAEGFDEEFENGYEDVDLCLRLLRDDRDRFLVVRECVAYHPEGSSRGRSLRDSANRVRFFERWAGRMPASEAYRYDDVGLRLDSMRPLWYSPEVPILITDPQVSRPVRGAGGGRPSLRWLLLTSDADGAVLQCVRDRLERLGQEIVEVGGGVHWSDGLADAVLAFSPGTPTFPRAGVFNVLVSDEAFADGADAVITGAPEDFESLIGRIESWRRARFAGPAS